MKPLAALGILLGYAMTPVAHAADVPPVYTVLFTHIEDNTPAGALGSFQSRQNYLLHRNSLIAMANLSVIRGVQWTLQPDWKFLEAALRYEDATLTANTNGKNLLRFLKEDRAVAIDPHSHENGGYNYSDVAHLLDSLGVGGSTVIGGHIWDPSLPQFQEWDRFRVPVSGERYPGAQWRGDILIGAGTPGHVNDPTISGVWRPRDRDHFFEHDAGANIVAIGSWKRSVQSIGELIALYRSGVVPTSAMLTFSTNVTPASLTAPGGLAAVEDSVIDPVVAWRDSGLVVATDFTGLVAAWLQDYGGTGYLYDANAPVVSVPQSAAASSAIELSPAAPHPVRGATWIRFRLARPGGVRIRIADLAGREVAVPLDGQLSAGDHAVRWEATNRPSGVYLCMLRYAPLDGEGVATMVGRRLIVLR